MSNLYIGPAAIEDVDAIMEVEKTGISHPWTRESIAALIRDENKAAVKAEEDGKVIGYIGASYVIDEAEIGNICVMPGSRGQGIGRKLLEAMLSYLRTKEVATVFLEVESENVAAIRLYESFGFTCYNTRRGYYGPGRDALLYRLPDLNNH